MRMYFIIFVFLEYHTDLFMMFHILGFNRLVDLSQVVNHFAVFLEFE